MNMITIKCENKHAQCFKAHDINFGIKLKRSFKETNMKSGGEISQKVTLSVT